ncbi:MAG TPA: AraC family transcriptional regulator [Thermoanaerobaculia bacterium]|nr:AraC family transcriptional regulator [Thermoanaerobaculia bacterium]
MLEIALKPVETVRFHGEIVALGGFRCPASHPLFRDSGPCNSNTFVFPRTMTAIRHEEGARFVGNPATVGFFNREQRYTRSAISNVDATDWYVVADDVLLEALSRFDRDVRPERPFAFTHAPADVETYVEQRRLFELAPYLDALAIEERVLALLRRVLAAAYRAQPRVSPALRDQVEAARAAITRDFTRNATLREIAAEAEASPYHLCRAFRRLTGETMTSYRHSLRLRVALERLRDRRVDLATLALDLGYDSHSHFTRAFRRVFGVPPSRYRATG